MSTATVTTDELQELVAGLQDMYDGLMTGDRDRFDLHLAPDTTTWETHFPQMMSRAELDAHRDQRPVGYTPPDLAAIRVEPRRAEIWGDTALVAYDMLLVAKWGGEPALTRVTDVLRKDDEGRWRVVHHHADTVRDLPDRP